MAPRPGLAYWLGTRLYVAVTNRCNATPLIVARGPSFALPADSGFAKLESDEPADEPTPQEIFEVVDSAYESDGRKRVIGMGEDDTGVTFAGYGEPLLRLDTVIESATLIRERRHGVPLRLKTNGLVPGGDNTAAVAQLVEAGVMSASVLLPGPDPMSFAKVHPQAEGDFGSLCDFVAQLAGSGVQVECSIIKMPGVDVSATRQLASALGAVETRAVTYHP
mmetsp:Transcript_10718/g.27072  ORF Transcript_10718/g.27072 Transcript_10718/m.27072 type:complete len:221 (+) Transcript_10718:228-890(+)